MRNITTILFCLIIGTSISQEINEKVLKSDVNEVTVFIEGAQITRKKSVDLKKGKTFLKFINLSPFIKAKSIQIKADGNITVLSVNHQQNFIDKLDKQKELVDLETSLQEVVDKLKLENTYLEIINEELAFMKENRAIGGKNQQISVSNLKEASIFYSTKLTSLKLKEIERNKTKVSLRNQKYDIENQIKTLTSKKKYPNGEILVKVDSKSVQRAHFELSYVVGNAGWFPSYDIRAINVSEPIELIYKANVKQDTKVDWNDVKLTLSSADPNVSGVVPELKTYFLNYNSLPPTYNTKISQVSGKVFDDRRIPLPGVNVMVKGTTIGSSTDFDGNYSITIPNHSSELQFSYIGFETQTAAIFNNTMNVYLKADENELDEVVVTAMGIKKERKALGYTVPLSEEFLGDSNNSMIALENVEKQTTVSFEIEKPYTIKSDNKSYSVDMKEYILSADYQYYSVPKINDDAFLIANITDWEKYNLLEGEANIFFEDTYIGKSLLDIRYATDTLQISLGRDKNVSVKREKVADYTSKKFVGSKKEESREWLISVKNNKNQKINMLVFDQIPISTLDEIKIEIHSISKAKYNNQTGELKWKFILEPNQKKNIELKYTVKYPKNKHLIIE